LVGGIGLSPEEPARFALQTEQAMIVSLNHCRPFPEGEKAYPFVQDLPMDGVDTLLKATIGCAVRIAGGRE
jgi:hypothetical protein